MTTIDEFLIYLTKNTWLIFVMAGLILIISEFYRYVNKSIVCVNDDPDVKNVYYDNCIAKSKQKIKVTKYFIIIGFIILGIGLIMYIFREKNLK
jgi:hypothetical protein